MLQYLSSTCGVSYNKATFTGNRVLPNNPSHLSYYKKPLGSVWSWHHRGCGTRRREPGRLGDRAAAPRDRRRRASKIPVIPVFSQQVAFCPNLSRRGTVGTRTRRGRMYLAARVNLSLTHFVVWSSKICSTIKRKDSDASAQC